MDLGIAGKNAIIAASSAGLGFACAESLAKEGVNVVINGRDIDRLNAAAEKLRLTATGSVTTVKSPGFIVNLSRGSISPPP